MFNFNLLSIVAALPAIIIAMAMHEMQSDVHDVEDTVLTITRVKRSYSPWSSKIYTLRETPLKK